MRTSARLLRAAAFAAGPTLALFAQPLSVPASAAAPQQPAPWLPLPPPLAAPPPPRDAPQPPLQAVIQRAFPSLVKISGSIAGRRVGGGSGFLVSDAGVLVTNDHVLSALLSAGCSEVLATFDDGRVYGVEALASDKEADIAIARLLAPPGQRFPALAFAPSEALRRGDAVVVLGAPLGGSLVPAVGVVSGNKHVADDELMCVRRGRAQKQGCRALSPLATRALLTSCPHSPPRAGPLCCARRRTGTCCRWTPTWAAAAAAGPF
jgi:S1-C subfamily serine protease